MLIVSVLVNFCYIFITFIYLGVVNVLYPGLSAPLLPKEKVGVSAEDQLRHAYVAPDEEREKRIMKMRKQIFKHYARET